MEIFDLTGKVAVVTGGNGGIGLGMARGLARAGANIAVVARNEEKSAQAVQSLQGMGVQAQAFQADVTDADAVSNVIDAVTQAFGGIHILINNAGINIRKRPEDLKPDEWQLVLNTNLTSAYLCSRACYPVFKRAGGGKILNNGSMLSIFGTPWGPAYAASKGGMVQLTKSLATAWAEDDIQVNCFLPGWVDTELTRNARREVDDLHERVLARTPAGRWGDVEDFEGLAVFLASSASDFITGAVIPVDGGFSVSG
ncbi:MAG: glucose 1-dehydrogenase [Gammaproteobacteria bacterium]|nr:MAG: glucose 1-dehydrogenase [Gammaproteobacteria bacterium]